MNNNIQYKLCNICNFNTIICTCKNDKDINSSLVKNRPTKYNGSLKGKLMSLYIKELKLIVPLKS